MTCSRTSISDNRSLKVRVTPGHPGTYAMHLLQAGVAIEIIALWLGHEQISTTHGYIEADLNMKQETLAHLKAPRSGRAPKKATSNILAFLEAL